MRRKFRDFAYPKMRIEAFSDAVIAIVMTLLILELKAPDLGGKNLQETVDALLELKSEFAAWVISFLLIGIYWLQHHNLLHMATRIDLKIVTLNLISLMGVCLTPFTASLISHESHCGSSVFIFCFVFFLVSLTLCWMYHYISCHYLKDTYDAQSVRRHVRLSYFLGPGLYLIAAVSSWFSFTITYIILLLIPVLFLFPLDVEKKSANT
ncbi:MAG: DUF1211 domain-containing protein [Chitinophagaceae bacterium]|nr:DUF1211 domain-containing protein [Chitinophagaceae bacterium]